VQIVLPSIVSGLGLLLLLLGVFIDETLFRVILVSAGALLLWLDFFITMAIFRFTVRDINRKLRAIEERVSHGE
jgi:ABC-type spermidine/putrescine transport system permease subunit II